MKIHILLTIALSFAALASAGDISISDGRVFTNAAVVSQSGGRVCIRHSGGFVQVEKSLLTGELAQRYPADAAATAREDSKLAAEAQAKAEHDARVAEQIRTARSSVSTVAASVDSGMEPIKEAAREYAQRYFERNQPGSTNSWSFSMGCEVSEPEPMAGWLDLWRVSGEVGTRDLTAQGGISSVSHRFEAVVAKRGGGFTVIDFSKR